VALGGVIPQVFASTPTKAPAPDSRPTRTDEQRAATNAQALAIAGQQQAGDPRLQAMMDAQAQGQRIISTDQALGAPAQFVDNAAYNQQGDYVIGTSGSKPVAPLTQDQTIGPQSMPIQQEGRSGPERFSTDYAVTNKDGKVSTLNITGPNQRKGGGTMSVVPSQSVEDINRQIEALRSLREARNPGITTGGNRGSSAFSSMDDAMRQYQNQMAEIQQFRESAPRGRPGDRAKRKAVYEEADARAAAAETALNATMGIAGKRLDAEQSRQAGAAQAAQQERQFGLQQARLALDQSNSSFNQERDAAKYQLDRDKAELDLGRNVSQDSASAFDKFISSRKGKDGQGIPQVGKLMGLGMDLLKSPEFTQSLPEVAQRIMNGNPTQQDWELLYQGYMVKQSGDPSWWQFWKNPTPMDEVTQRLLGRKGAN
jgi:hypothetical protein